MCRWPRYVNFWSGWARLTSRKRRLPSSCSSGSAAAVTPVPARTSSSTWHTGQRRCCSDRAMPAQCA